MHVIKCDGCGCTYPIDGDNIVIRVTRNNHNNTQQEKSYDVCPRCLKHVGIWIGTVKEDFLADEEEVETECL